MKHLTAIDLLSKKEIESLIFQALKFKKKNLSSFLCRQLKGQVVANLFFEPSTRTRNSFEIAAYRMGAFVISPDMKLSSSQKGETLLDTVKTLEAMGVRAAIIRHPEEHVATWLSKQTNQLAIINAGDGPNQHPSQALIDLMTIIEHKKKTQDLTVAIVGDIKYSRVARSLIKGLKILGVSQIRLVAPPSLLPKTPIAPDLHVFNTLDSGLTDADVVICLRVQLERMGTACEFDPDHFKKHFCLTQQTLSVAKKDAIVMHPGPINRGIEISSDVADGPQSVILSQVENGVAIRMSILKWCL